MSEQDTQQKHGRGTPVGRRVVLGMVGLGVVGVAAGRWLSEGVSDVVASTAPGLAGVIPAAGGFRIYTVTSGYPDHDPATYRMTVTGLVSKELSLSLEDLAALPQTGITKDFQCVTGWRVNDVPWSGVLLRDVLAEAGVDADAAALRFTSFDGVYTESLTMEQGLRDDILVATSMYGQPLEVKHGAPVRLYVVPDVRVQVAQVAVRHRGGTRGRTRLLGEPRLRRRRLGGPVQRPQR